jgi:hypothetical protein
VFADSDQVVRGVALCELDLSTTSLEIDPIEIISKQAFLIYSRLSF